MRPSLSEAERSSALLSPWCIPFECMLDVNESLYSNKEGGSAVALLRSEVGVTVTRACAHCATSIRFPRALVISVGGPATLVSSGVGRPSRYVGAAAAAVIGAAGSDSIYYSYRTPPAALAMRRGCAHVDVYSLQSTLSS
ncbi:hypothetical protein EVAR_44930_1 [Eumeta japonica]|uniref:Uncharacterized protein n=1 Tax=Eumeta variegata TaxID=151549 RepID=A0A4C2A8B8_EUMVA|nr:hypothetical protein EVAR_44930_1 [Eumeta japonica]